MARGNPNPSPATRFVKGDPRCGHPPGQPNKTTLLKEKILSAALKIDLEGNRVLLTKKGKRIVIPNIAPEEILKLGAGFVPKEIKGEGFETNINVTSVLNSSEIDPEARRGLIEILRKRRSAVESPKLD